MSEKKLLTDQTRRCEYCATPGNVIFLIPLEGKFARTIACGRKCVDSLHTRYMKYFLEASVRAVS